MNTPIHLSLLRSVPLIKLNNEEIHLSEASLELFIYLAVENKPVHDRDVLTRRLYETTQHRDRFRKTALGAMDKRIKDVIIRSSPTHSLGYEGTHVYVDANKFSETVDSIYNDKSINSSEDIYDKLLLASELYQDDFLRGYQASLYGLNAWILEKQRTFRELFHSVMERLVQYEIAEDKYEQALVHAERWHQSQPDNDLPLQYLIWLTANLDTHSQVQNYLRKLDRLNVTELRLIGYSPQEWRRLLNRNIKPGKEALKLQDVANIEISELIDIASGHLIGRDAELENIFELLNTQDHKAITITGKRGIGKTKLAETVAQALVQTKLIDRVISIGVTLDMHFDHVLNVIARNINQPHLSELNYKNKFLSIVQRLEAENSLLLIDQQEVGNVFSEDFRKRVQELSQSTKILICCHEAWEALPSVELTPLGADDIINIFSSNVKLIPEWDFKVATDNLSSITEGFPLALILLAKAIKTHQLTLDEALAQLGNTRLHLHTHHPSDLNYILEWCWQLLNEPTRRVFASLMIFSLLEGPTPTILRELHDNLTDEEVEFAIQQLESMQLIEITGEPGLYRWHSLIHDFLHKKDALAYATKDPDFKSQIERKFCILYLDYFSNHYKDYPTLDQQQRNLVQAFGLGFTYNLTTLTQVNRLLPYLIARGFYDNASEIAMQAEFSVETPNTSKHVELLLNIAKFKIKQGEFDEAKTRLDDALSLCANLGLNIHLGDIYQQLGIVVKTYGQFEQSDEFYERALRNALEQQNSNLVSVILANRGSAAVERGDYGAAKEYLKESLEFAQSVPNLRVMEFTNTALGVVACEELAFELAQQHLEKSQKIVHKTGSPERQAYIYNTMAVAHYYKGQYEETETVLKNGLEIAQRLRHEELIALMTRNLGRVEAVKGNLLYAERLYKQALIASEDRGLRRLATSILLDIGKVNFQAHNAYYTFRCFQQALRQSLELEIYDLTAEALFGLGATAVADKWIVGNGDIRKVVEAIQAFFDSKSISSLDDMNITKQQLQKAEFLFQYGLVNYPDIDRYHITKALDHLINGSV